MSTWSGLPTKITDAFLWTDGVTYFFNGDNYYPFNDADFKAEKSRLNINGWFNCQNKTGILIILAFNIKNLI